MLVAPLVARSWRLTWAIRAAGLVVVFGWLAVLDDRGLKVRLPEPGVLLAPVAVGLALSAACIAAAFQDDVLGRVVRLATAARAAERGSHRDRRAARPRGRRVRAVGTRRR